MYTVSFITDQLGDWEAQFNSKEALADFFCEITHSANRDGHSGKYIAWDGSNHEVFSSPAFKLQTTYLNNDEEFIDFCLTMYGRTDAYDNEDDNRPSITVNGQAGEIFNTGAGARWKGNTNVRPHDYAFVNYFQGIRGSEHSDIQVNEAGSRRRASHEESRAGERC